MQQLQEKERLRAGSSLRVRQLHEYGPAIAV
jgi:hypothetical protein